MKNIIKIFLTILTLFIISCNKVDNELISSNDITSRKSTNCTSFVYSSWSSCVNGIQTRAYTGKPAGCITSPPIDSVRRTCTSPVNCTFTYGSWTTCSNGIQTRSYTSNPIGCTGTPPSDSISKVCSVPTPGLPSSFALITPPIENQGNEGSCMAFACAYARGIEQYYRTNAIVYNTSINIFSQEYIYNQTKLGTDCNSGTAISVVLDLFKNKGVCVWSVMPYSDINGCSILPTAAQDSNATNYKITSYSKIVDTDRVAIKTMVYNKHAVIVGITADNGFVNAKTGFIWKSYSGSGALPHAVIICGWDDSKNAFKIMNSWGTSWGDAGYSWIDYNYFLKIVGYYGYSMNY
jgi:C1A family cysteine protease